ncbi:MAG: polysaccharide deacetylase family protein [Gemmatimonadaceae bacterium]|nr:polysaccharide deacetylase family protein [Gemmatimonadaceae bacterium]
MSALAMSGAALAMVGALAHGTWYRNSPVFGRVISRVPGDGLRVALTFDDGPNPEATPRILDALASLQVQATFFLLGKHVDRWPDIAARVAAEGHTVGNHGWHHRKLHVRSPSYVRDDITRGAASIEQATGVTPHLFRAPHGFRNPWVSPIARALGEQVVGWSLGVWDSACPGVDVIVQRTLNGVRPGSIVLLHDGDGYDATGDRLQTAAAVTPIVQRLRERGYGEYSVLST